MTEFYADTGVHFCHFCEHSVDFTHIETEGSHQMLNTRTKNILKMNKEIGMHDAAKKRANTSGVGESNNYYEDIYNIQQHSLTTPVDSTH